MNKEAYQRVTYARSLLLMDHPFFGCMVSQLKPVELIGLGTMAVDGTHMFYDPEFVLEVSEDHLVGSTAHEGLHCGYRHHIRMGGRDPDDWNIAGDYRINFDLIKAGFKLPDWVYYDIKYATWSAEEIYNDICKPNAPRNRLKPQPGNGHQGQSGNGQQQSNQQQNGQQQSQNKGSQQQGQGQSGQQPGQQGKGGAQGNSQSSDGQGQSDSGKPQVSCNDPGRMGGVISPVPIWDKASAEIEEIKWEIITKQAINIARAQNAGNTPGYLDGLFKDLGRSKVPWEQLLRKFIDDSVEKTYSWSNPNRRHLHSGLILPGMVPDKLRHIVSVMDTSGSTVSNKLVAKYAAEKRALLDEGLCDKLTVIYADTHVRNVQEFERGDDVVLNPKGGGGTNFRPVMDYIAKNCYDASLILFFTDADTMDWGDDPGKPVMWLVYGTAEWFNHHATKAPYGEPLHVDER